MPKALLVVFLLFWIMTGLIILETEIKNRNEKDAPSSFSVGIKMIFYAIVCGPFTRWYL